MTKTIIISRPSAKLVAFIDKAQQRKRERMKQLKEKFEKGM